MSEPGERRRRRDLRSDDAPGVPSWSVNAGDDEPANNPSPPSGPVSRRALRDPQGEQESWPTPGWSTPSTPTPAPGGLSAGPSAGPSGPRGGAGSWPGARPADASHGASRPGPSSPARPAGPSHPSSAPPARTPAPAAESPVSRRAYRDTLDPTANPSPVAPATPAPRPGTRPARPTTA
jgi:hypothetical protein